MPDVIDIDDITQESYALLVRRLPEYITMNIAEEFDRLLWAVPADIGRVSDVKAMMEFIMLQFGDMGDPLDYEAIGVLSDTRERLKANLEKHATDPEEAMARIMTDLTEALKGIGDKILSKFAEFEVPAISYVGAIYRFHGVKNSQLAFRLLTYEETMKAGGL